MQRVELLQALPRAERHRLQRLSTRLVGQVLRRFTDTNGDNKGDQFRYYNLGIEVYRDIDSDGNEKIDQYRWLNTGGTRWGLDPNEDGRIDTCKLLAPN